MLFEIFCIHKGWKGGVFWGLLGCRCWAVGKRSAKQGKRKGFRWFFFNFCLCLGVPKKSNLVIVNSRGFIAFSALCLDHWVVMGALAEVWVGYGLGQGCGWRDRAIVQCGDGSGSTQVGFFCRWVGVLWWTVPGRGHGWGDMQNQWGDRSGAPHSRRWLRLSDGIVG